jgi:hypothetical protein
MPNRLKQLVAPTFTTLAIDASFLPPVQRQFEVAGLRHRRHPQFGKFAPVAAEEGVTSARRHRKAGGSLIV